jgi:hypothetical protein
MSDQALSGFETILADLGHSLDAPCPSLTDVDLGDGPTLTLNVLFDPVATTYGYQLESILTQVDSSHLAVGLPPEVPHGQ